MVMPTPKSLGVNHSFTSSLDVSKTQVGKFAIKKKDGSPGLVISQLSEIV